MCNPPHSAPRDRSRDVWRLLTVVAWGKITILFDEVGHGGSGSSERFQDSAITGLRGGRGMGGSRDARFSAHCSCCLQPKEGQGDVRLERGPAAGCGHSEC